MTKMRNFDFKNGSTELFGYGEVRVGVRVGG
jgi:hypothetical protein